MSSVQQIAERFAETVRSQWMFAHQLPAEAFALSPSEKRALTKALKSAGLKMRRSRVSEGAPSSGIVLWEAPLNDEGTGPVGQPSAAQQMHRWPGGLA